MKQVTVQYATTWREISVPDNATVLRYGTPEYPEMSLHPHPEEATKRALASPIGIEPLADLVRPGSTVTIAFDDGFKHPLPLKTIMPILLDELNRLGVPDENIELVCAVGGHRKCTAFELRDLLGPEVFARFCPFDGAASRIRNHDCVDGNVFLGVTELGDHVEYDRALVDSDQLIYVGTIKPLGFGGYAGQGVAIGLASHRTLDSLHAYSIYKTREVLNAEHLPEKNVYRRHKLAAHAKVEEAIGKRIFYVDALVGPGNQILDVFAGHVPELEDVEYRRADENYIVDVPQFDIVINGVAHDTGYDTTDNPACLGTLSQVLRMARNRPLLREGGALISLAQCRGIISKHRPADHEALRLFRDCFDVEELFLHREHFANHPEYLRAYKHHHAFSPKHSIMMCGDAAHHWKLTAASIVAGDVVPGLIREHGLIPTRNFDQALGIAMDVVGKKNPDILVLPRFFADPRPVFSVQS